MSSDLCQVELDCLYETSGVTRSLKRGRYSPTLGGREDLGPHVPRDSDRRMTRRVTSRINHGLTVSVQNSALQDIGDVTLSPGEYRSPGNLETSETESDSMPPLAPSDLSFGSEDSRYSILIKDGDTIADVTDCSSSTSEADTAGESDSSGEDGDKDGAKLDRSINNNLDGEFPCLFPLCPLTQLCSISYPT